VIVTFSANSFVNTADKIRAVHMARADACREPLRRHPAWTPTCLRPRPLGRGHDD
jgi:hypothetical protein